ncbi:MAG: DUF898 domain-containing protein [Desulfobulbus sp.]|jgi:uncharacterized membrane protein YjgN (DUF898 family)|uniref:YjgN family protein n=1 Tax=Desulfobulbus sp. TaxID=895 RepID=UPI00284172E7|nr:YjgN family protein [Desulfobulbus sp.]MDR2549559.1 DUF898 domain-containing protein [Desulfobulbus sp.]
METNEREYALVFQGQVAEGQDVEEVKTRFAAFMRCDSAKTEALFVGRRIIVKRFPTREAAEQGAARLRQLGMVMEVVAVEKKTAPSTPMPAPVTEEQAPAADLSISPENPAEAPPRPPRPPRPTATGERRLPFVFSGSGGEFYKIWVVNVLLTILTLGIWSAWAKVRTMRYFYGNTTLGGNAFEYLAEPVKILKGRLLVFAVFAAFSAVAQFYPLINPIGGLILLVLTPWIVRQSLRFQRHYTAWRGVRFAFVGSLGESFRAFLLWPMLTAFLFFLPVIWHRQTHYLIDQSCYGSARFANRSTVGNFFVAFAILTMLALALGAAGGMAFAALGQMAQELLPEIRQMSALAGVVLASLAWMVVSALYKVRMVNLRFGKTEIGPHRIVTSYAFGSYLWLVLTNTLGIMLSLGLYYPFAKVRTARYAAAHTEMIVQGDLDDFVASHQAGVSALGGEAADFFDIDIGF